MASDLRSELSADETVAESAEKTVVADSISESAAIETQEVSDESAARADLNLVSNSTSDAESIRSNETASIQDSGRRGIPIWLAIVGLLIAALFVSYQMRSNGQLKAEITGLEAKLGRTEAVLDAHKAHLGNIRGGVSDLAAQLQSLQTLVETEPVTARDEGTSAQP